MIIMHDLYEFSSSDRYQSTWLWCCTKLHWNDVLKIGTICDDIKENADCDAFIKMNSKKLFIFGFLGWFYLNFVLHLFPWI